MDVINAEQARIAEEAGACAVMALERVPADIRKNGKFFFSYLTKVAYVLTFQKKRWCCPYVRSSNDQGDYGSRYHPRHG